MNEKCDSLSRFYCSVIKKGSRRIVQRLDPVFKNSICKGCDSILIPGQSGYCGFKLDESLLVISCYKCQQEKKFCLPTGGFVRFSDNYESRESTDRSLPNFSGKRY